MQQEDRYPPYQAKSTRIFIKWERSLTLFQRKRSTILSIRKLIVVGCSVVLREHQLVEENSTTSKQQMSKHSMLKSCTRTHFGYFIACVWPLQLTRGSVKEDCERRRESRWNCIHLSKVEHACGEPNDHDRQPTRQVPTQSLKTQIRHDYRICASTSREEKKWNDSSSRCETRNMK